MNELMREILIEAGFELVTDDLPPTFVWSLPDSDVDWAPYVAFHPTYYSPHAFCYSTADYPDQFGSTTAELAAALAWLNDPH